MSGLFKLARWLILFVVGVVIGIVVIRWLMRDEDDYEVAVRTPTQQRLAGVNIPLPSPPAAPVAELSPTPVTAAPPGVSAGREEALQPDDLKQIDGVGPAYARGLAALGITTFAQLAAQDPDDLTARLRARGVRIIGDSVRSKDWIGQARRLAGA